MPPRTTPSSRSSLLPAGVPAARCSRACAHPRAATPGSKPPCRPRSASAFTSVPSRRWRSSGSFSARPRAGWSGRGGGGGVRGGGVGAAAWQGRGGRAEVRALRAAAPATPPWTRFERIAAIALALVALPALVAPLAPPAAFDELMYHLPYARLVAQQGTLGIHDWLRYPWFPYNYNLLYAAALQVGDDVLPHFLNALAGALSVLMIFRLGILHANRLTACIGAAIWLGMGDYANALIDMGVALFVLSAFVALWWWRESEPLRDGTRWLCLA